MSASSIKPYVSNPRLKNASNFPHSVNSDNHTIVHSAKKTQILHNTENVPVSLHNRFQVLTDFNADDNGSIQTSTSACDLNMCDTDTLHFVEADMRSFQHSQECKHSSSLGVPQPLLADQANYSFSGNKNETGYFERGNNYTKTCSGVSYTLNISRQSTSQDGLTTL